MLIQAMVIFLPISIFSKFCLKGERSIERKFSLLCVSCSKMNLSFKGLSLQFITRLFQVWLKEKKDAASIISTLKKNEMDDKLLVSK